MIPECFRPKHRPAEVWKEYEKCRGFNQSIDLYETVKKNERFVSGDQWNGVKAPDIDKVTLNMLDRTVMYQIAQIVSDNIGVSVLHQNQENNATNEALAKYLEHCVEDVLEDTNFGSRTRECLRDAAVDGDCALYAYWDADKDKPLIERIANTSVLFGNPSVTTVEDQPYIIIEQSKDITDVKWQAYTAGIENWDAILCDDQEFGRQSDIEYRHNSTCTVLKKFWRDISTGTIWFTECTRTVTLREPVDTKLSLYPIAWMNWEAVKECYHGKSVVSGNIENQIALNRLWTAILYHERTNAFPKIFYDRSKIQRWDNAPGATYAVAGGLSDSVATAFKAPEMDHNVLSISDKLIGYTRDFMGVNDAVLGNVNPTNTSAILAVQKSAAVPLELQKRAYYQFVEDIIRVVINLLILNLGERDVKLTMAAQDPNTGMVFDTSATAHIDFNLISYDDLKLRVDIGEASYWSEMTQIQTMDNLFTKGLIADPVMYLESIPDRLLPFKNKIVDKLKAQMGQAQSSNIAGTEDITKSMEGELPSTRPEQYLDRKEDQMNEEVQGV